jgi:hypothetical protein
MNFKVLIGFIKWKLIMKKLGKVQPYTDEWWQKCADALQFLPENDRVAFLNTFVAMMVQM